MSDLLETVQSTVRDTDLSPLQRVILLQLLLAQEDEPLSASEVGEPIGLSAMTVHTNLRKLVATGRVAVEKVPNFDREQFETAYRLTTEAESTSEPDPEPVPA